MALKTGTQLGPYEILALIGVGGMGEVYKARDGKLNRLVALKVLPASLAGNRDFLARFEREAKAVAALSHPNVLGIFDLASQDGLTYAVMELLEGDSLRDRLKAGALPPKRAVEIAAELAQGLAAAHARGIIHRDVKPENIFITREGRVKVLDFGLAKQIAGPRGNLAAATQALSDLGTEAGMVLGTAGYMSPEQVRGEPADHRADIFAFGVVLYEMLSGQRPFKGESPVQTMAAILEQDPPALVASRGPLAPALERLVAHCLEKHPEGRFQSMMDIAFALQNLSTLSDPAGPAAVPGPRRPPLARNALGAGLVLVLMGLLWAFHLPPFRPPSQPTFTRLTFAPGTVDSAFFGPDGRTVYFSERILGGRPEIFALHPDDPEPRSLGVQDAILLGVSPSNELAIMRSPRAYMQRIARGMLAHVGGGGGSARDLQANILDAAWDGQGHALLSTDDHLHATLEFPAGHVLLQCDSTMRMMTLLRLSRDREHLALVDSDSFSKSEVVAYDRAGQRKVLYTKIGDAEGDTLTGLAWGPDGDLWLSEQEGDQTDIWSLSLKGRRRLVWRGEGDKALMDVSAEGRILLADHQVRRGVLVQKAGEGQAREISVGGSTQGTGLSADGKAMMLLESPVLDGGAHQDQCYLNRLDGTPAVKICKGTGTLASADGRWLQVFYSGMEPEELDPGITAAFRQAGMDPRVVLDPKAPQSYLLFVSTGADRPFAVALPRTMEQFGSAYLHPDGRRVIFEGLENGRSSWYSVDRQGGVPKIFSKPGQGYMLAGLMPITADGRRLIVSDGGGHFLVQPVDGGEPEPIRGISAEDRPLCWCLDGKAIFVRNHAPALLPVLVSRLDLATGAQKEVFRFSAIDPAGLVSIRTVYLPGDGKVFAMTYSRQMSQLYRVEGLR